MTVKRENNILVYINPVPILQGVAEWVVEAKKMPRKWGE